MILTQCQKCRHNSLFQFRDFPDQDYYFCKMYKDDKTDRGCKYFKAKDKQNANTRDAVPGMRQH